MLNSPLSYSDPTGQYGEAAFLGITIWTWVAIAASTAIVILASQALANNYQNSLGDQAPVPLPTNTGSGTTAINDGPSPEWRDSGFGPPNSQPLLTTNGGGYNLWDSFSEGFKGTFSGFKTLFTDPLSLIRPLSFSEAMQETMGMLMPGSKVTFAQQRANTVLSSGDVDGYAEIQGGLFGDAVMDGLSLVPIGRLAKFAKIGRAAKGATNAIPRTKDVLGHIFKNTPGHVNPATAASQSRYLNLFEKVANNSKNLNQSILKPSAIKNGVQGYTQTFRNGQQIWVHSRNGRIFDAGVNLIPR